MNFFKFFSILVIFGFFVQIISLQAFAQSNSPINSTNQNFSSLFSTINDSNFSTFFSSNSQNQDLITISQPSGLNNFQSNSAQIIFSQSNSQSNLNSQSSSSSSSSNTIINTSNQISTQNLTGEIQSVQDKVLVLNSNGKNTSFSIPDNIKIIRNSVSAKISDLKPRDQVTIVQTMDGKIISVDSIASGEVSDFSKFAIPLLIILLLLIGLGLYFWNQNKKGKIKTTTTNLE